MSDYKKASDGIASAMKQCGIPLSADQKIMLSGSLAVWFEKIATDKTLSLVSTLEELDNLGGLGNKAHAIIRAALKSAGAK